MTDFLLQRNNDLWHFLIIFLKCTTTIVVFYLVNIIRNSYVCNRAAVTANSCRARPVVGIELHKRPKIFRFLFGAQIKTDISSNLMKSPDDSGAVFCASLFKTLGASF